MADPTTLKYTAEHEWLLVDPSTGSGQALPGDGSGQALPDGSGQAPPGDGSGRATDAGGIATIGITAYAADKLGDVVFVDLPVVGTVVANGKIVGEIESTKSVGELFAPVDGTVVEVNDAVVANPELVNSDPFGEGWLIRVQFTALPTLLSHDEYAALVGE